MDVQIKNVDIDDIDKFNEAGMNIDLSDHYKLIATDDAGNSGYMFIPITLFDSLGMKYISTHVSLEYSEVCGEWFVKLSQNDYHNDFQRNPPKIIHVKFIENKAGENTEVWQNVDTGRYYLRMLCNEPFARWMTCGSRRTGWEDQQTIRPNITFENVANGQMESVRYNDWNDVAAYSDTFNSKFRCPDGEQSFV